MALTVSSPGSPSTLFTTIHVSGPDDMEKKRRKRTIITVEQLSKLEELYKQEQWPNRERKGKLAKEIGMSTHFVNIWFQNKRSRMKKMAQEEVELAAMREECKRESQNVQEKQSANKPIAPKSPAVATVKSALQARVNRSPIIHLKVPFNLASPQAHSQTLSPVLKTLKPKFALNNSDQNKSDDNNKTALQVAPAESAVSLLEQIQQGTTAFPTSKCETMIASPARHIVVVSPAAHKIQMLAQQQQVQTPQVRFGTNPAVVLDKLPLPSSTTVQDPVQIVSRQDTESSSCRNKNTATNSLPTNSLFDCLVAMAALEEGGLIQKDDPTYDIAVNSALYGVKVDDEMIVSYDRKKGMKFLSTASDEGTSSF